MKSVGLTVGYGTIVALALIGQLLPVPDTNRSIPLILLALQLGFFIALFRPLSRIIRREPDWFAQTMDDLRRNWPWLLATALVYISLALTLEAGTGIKKSISLNNPFYADAFLIDLDRRVFGTDPWHLTHAVLGWATPAISGAYVLWQAVQIGLGLLIAFCFDDAVRIRFALCFQLAWLLIGGAMATAFSSVGPIMVGHFYGDSSFDPLIATVGRDAPQVLQIRDMLIGTLADPTVVSGISAMPSMHVAISVLFALFVARFGKPVLTGIAWAYALLIYVGSIHLGWHYASDGVVSALCIVAIWWLTGRYVAWLETLAPASVRDGASADQERASPTGLI